MQTKTSALYAVGILTFFLTIFDGILAYVIPIEVTTQGYSKTAVGFILGFSSIAGAWGDILLSKFLKSSNFRRLFLAMYICCLLYAITLWQANGVFIYLLAMAFWGLYFDLRSFATFNFIGRFTPHRLHAHNFGILDVFKCLGYVIAPLIASMLIVDQVTDQPFLIALLFLGFSISAYFGLVFLTKTTHERVSLRKKNYSLLLEIDTWKKIGKYIAPVLLFTFLISMYDAFFWTLGPFFGGIFLSLYFLPTLVVGWFVGRFTKRYGKKRTAFISFALGSVVISFVGFANSSWLILIVVLVSSTFSAIAWPAINGAYADYIEESPHLEQEIEGVTDFAYNLAYILGPITAGILADRFGNGISFTIFGTIALIMSIILLAVTPRRIHVPNKI